MQKMNRAESHGQRTLFPRSRSFDPRSLPSYPSPGHVTSNNPLGENTHMVDNALFGLSSLGLQETPRRDGTTSVYPTITSPSRDVNMMSPLSDRSIEPMMVSDVSGDLDVTDDVPNPFGGSQSTKSQYEDDDRESVRSDGTEWLWSLGLKDVKKPESDFDTNSVMTDTASCVSGYTGSVRSDATASTHDSEQTLTHRRGTPSVLSRTSTIPESVFEREYKPFNNNTHVKVTSGVAGTDPRSRQNRCRRCFLAVNFIVVLSLVAGLFIMAGKDMQGARCSDYLQYNISGLQSDLEKHVFGQHLAREIVIDSLSNLISNSSKNVTVLSFHGWTGIGKNFVSSFVAKQLREDTVRKIIIPLDFAHSDERKLHEHMMFTRIVDNIPVCGFILFIIDEADKASPEAIKGLHSALKNITIANLPNVKVLIFLLSNSGGSAINRYLLDHLDEGHTRESVHMENVVDFMLKVDNAQISHEWYIPMLSEGLIDFIVPFLPLERAHIVLCAKRYISETRPLLGNSDVEQITEHVLQHMAFFPQGREVFSSTGCRGVSMKVDLVID